MCYLTIPSTRFHHEGVNDLDPQMLKGLVSVLLLRLIAQAEDYGYALVVRLREAGLADMAEGTVYPALSRLERLGQVESFLVPSEKGPARKYYRITPVGEDALAQGAAGWKQLSQIVTTLLEGDRP